jgi:probable F420-dependent oxidoreductase
MTAMGRHRADPADLGPAVETQTFAGHRHERPVAADPQVITKLDGPVEKRPRLGLGDELEHLGDVGGAKRDRLPETDPGDTLTDHLHQLKRPDRIPTGPRRSAALEDRRVVSRDNKTGGVLPVLGRRLRRQTKERGHIDRISEHTPPYLRKPRMGPGQSRVHRIVEKRFVGRQHAAFSITRPALHAVLWRGCETISRMRLGLHALGIGAGARRAVIDAVAVAAEAEGFATLWSGEHIVMVDRPESRYPYSADGRIAVPAAADWLDPLIGLSFVAAATRRIELATGVLLLPEHNPLLLAKQAASLDVLSGGRLRLGVGIGWSREEFAALGIPFERRGERAAEYVAAMRVLWREDIASFGGEFVAFDSVRVNPKPIRERQIPIVLGGNSDAALRRVAAWGDGWYGFNLAGVDAVRERIGMLQELCRENGRDVRALRLAVALDGGAPGDIPALKELGVSELVLVEAPPDDPGAAANWAGALARRWMAATS